MADDNPIHETATGARAGNGHGVMRHVLIASLVLVVVAFVLIVATGTWIVG